MKLNKLRIRGFRNITDTTLEVGGAKFVVVRGANRNGKTSIAEALSLALTPTTWGLSAKGDGYARKIKRGEIKAIIEAELQGASRTIRRTTTLGFTGRVQSSEDIADASYNCIKFDKFLEDKKTSLGIAINTRAFQSLIYAGDEKAQKSLLAQLVLPAHYDFPAETIAEVEAVLGEGVVEFHGEPFAVIEQAYKRLFNERQDVNRKVKEFIIPEPLPRPQGVNSESLKAKLATLRDMRVMKAGDRDAAAKKANESVLKRDRANAKIETLEAVLRASKETLQALHANILPDTAAVQEVASRKAERDKLVAERERLIREEEAVIAERDRLLKLAKIGSTCPTCEQGIDESQIIKLIEAADAKRTQLTEQYDKKAHAVSLLGDVDGAVAKLERHKKAIAEQDELAGTILNNTTALDQAKDEANASYGGLFDSSSFDDALAKTDKNIETILQQIQPVIAAEEKDKEIAAKKEQLQRLEDKAAKVDKLVRYFDKDGIKAKLIAEYIGSFENRMNHVLDAWGYKCSFSIEPYRLELIDTKGVSTPIIDVSGAEELFFCAAFQCAVSAASGVGFVVIDRVDTLLPEIRRNLYQKLYSMLENNHLEQVLLLVADTSTTIANLKDSLFFIVEDGKIRPLS